MKLIEAHELILDECIRARKKFSPFNSAHEGYAVILEEMDELWEEIKNNPKNWNKIREEAIQMAAMGMRFLIDLERMKK